MNSIKQTKAAIYPVRMASLVAGAEQPGVTQEDMQGDVLWCTEMERWVEGGAEFRGVCASGEGGWCVVCTLLGLIICSVVWWRKNVCVCVW